MSDKLTDFRYDWFTGCPCTWLIDKLIVEGVVIVVVVVVVVVVVAQGLLVRMMVLVLLVRLVYGHHRHCGFSAYQWWKHGKGEEHLPLQTVSRTEWLPLDSYH